MSLTSKHRSTLIIVAAALLIVVSLCVLSLVRRKQNEAKMPTTAEELIGLHLDAVGNTRNLTAEFKFSLEGESSFKELAGTIVSKDGAAVIETVLTEVDGGGTITKTEHYIYYVDGIYTYRNNVYTEEWDKIDTPYYLSLLATYIVKSDDFTNAYFSAGTSKEGAAQYVLSQPLGDSVLFDALVDLGWAAEAFYDEEYITTAVWLFDENCCPVNLTALRAGVVDPDGNILSLSGYMDFDNVGKLPDELDEALTVPAEAFE